MAGESAGMETLPQLVRTGISFLEACQEWILVLICVMIFSLVVTLPVILPRLLPRQRASRNQPQTVSAGNEQKDPIETALEDLRLHHQVRPLRVVEETCGLKKLPTGIYGFTLLPARMDAPVWKTNSHDLFEVHKMADGSILMVGFASPETAIAMETVREKVEVKLFASPTPEASVLVCIPLSHVMRGKQRRSRQDNVLELEIEPPSSWTGQWEWRAPRKPPQAERGLADKDHEAGAG